MSYLFILFQNQCKEKITEMSNQSKDWVDEKELMRRSVPSSGLGGGSDGRVSELTSQVTPLFHFYLKNAV
jgi:hypothetical protein